MTVRILHGDALEQLRTLADESVHSVVCDPPYGLEFMGKEWDTFKTGRAEKYAKGGGIDSEAIARQSGKGGAGPQYVSRPARRCAKCGKQAWSGSPCACTEPAWTIDNSPLHAFQDWTEAWARECLRVLKPGGHLLSFGGSRTYHRMACAIEDAGFEIRDQIMWVYGSGFPKSLDVSKAIDRANGKHERDLLPFAAYVRQCREAMGWSLRELDDAMGTNTAASWWEGRKGGIQPPGRAVYARLKSVLGMDGRFDDLIEWLEAEREVVGSKRAAIALPGLVHTEAEKQVDITAPATDAARQWQGWGTALKPAHEPIVVARKPLIGTVAANVLAHGTGAINVDGCRIGAEVIQSSGSTGMDSRRFAYGTRPRDYGASVEPSEHLGRWPANIIHDGSDEVLAGFPETGPSSGGNTGRAADGAGWGYVGLGGGLTGFGDSGSAARFFKEIECESQSTAGTVASPLSLRSVLAATARDAVAIWPSLAGVLEESCPGRFTSVTESESKAICESVITAIAPIGCGFLLASQHSRRTQNASLASAVAVKAPTGITTITASLSKSDGSVDAATYTITPSKLDRGGSDSDRSLFYTAKASGDDRNIGSQAPEESNHHPTVKPTDLMQYLVRLVTPPGGTVLDPFAGSGSTGIAADREGFDAILIERDAEYVEIARRRIVGDCPLFAEIAA